MYKWNHHRLISLNINVCATELDTPKFRAAFIIGRFQLFKILNLIEAKLKKKKSERKCTSTSWVSRNLISQCRVLLNYLFCQSRLFHWPCPSLILSLSLAHTHCPSRKHQQRFCPGLHQRLPDGERSAGQRKPSLLSGIHAHCQGERLRRWQLFSTGRSRRRRL